MLIELKCLELRRVLKNIILKSRSRIKKFIFYLKVKLKCNQLEREEKQEKN